jgi:dGTPase
LPEAISRFPWNLELHTYSGLEAQIAALADDIAYISHDIDDALRAGLFSVDDLRAAPLAGPIFSHVLTQFPELELSRLIGEAVRRIITTLVSDVTEETERRLRSARPQQAADIRGAARPTAVFSEALLREIVGLKQFLGERMYRHPRIIQVMRSAQEMLTKLFDALADDPVLLPPDWRQRCGVPRDRATARAVCDYIAGMTDRFAAQEYRRIFHTEFPL